MIKRPGLLLLILITLFFTPLFVAWFLYGQHISLNKHLTNRGNLILPPFSVNELQLRNAKNVLVENPQQDHWLLLLFYPATCKTECEKNIYYLQQIRIATGKDQNRILRAVIRYRNNKLQHTYNGTQYFFVDPKHYEIIINQHVKNNDGTELGAIFIVDPKGNVMMSYPATTNPEQILHDLKHLLTLSQIG